MDEHILRMLRSVADARRGRRSADSDPWRPLPLGGGNGDGLRRRGVVSLLGQLVKLHTKHAQRGAAGLPLLLEVDVP